ncbi:MAG: hypothetical protein KGJ90_04705 [Patescibacteria group bacterium]|nr:hypothetical protein [Patescibacteria group bacterium]
MAKKMKPKGARGKAAVKRLGRSYKTGGFNKIASKAAKEYGSKEAGKKVAASIYWKKVHGSRKKGGPIKKTGLYKLHKGEHVLTAKQKKYFAKGHGKIGGKSMKEGSKAEERGESRAKENRERKMGVDTERGSKNMGSMKNPSRAMAAKAANKIFG